MGFLVFSVKNVFRSRLRLVLTLFLLVIGIVALGFSLGVSFFADDLLQIPSNDNGGLDFSIYSNNTDSNNTFSLGELNRIQSIKGVKEVVGTSLFTTIIKYKTGNITGEYHPYWMGFHGKFTNDSRVPGVGHIKLIKGRLPTPGTHEILITNDFAKDMNIKVGENLTITNMENLKGVTQNINTNPSYFNDNNDAYTKSIQMNFTVVGTIPGLYNGQKSAEKFHTTPPDAIINLDIANQIVYGSNTTKFDFIHVKGDANHIDQIKNELLKSNPYYIIWEEESNNKINTMILCIILFSLIIGSILMLVTTLKSVSERTREIGVLKAIGWSNKRVMSMVFIESITQTIIAWTIAIILLLTFMTLQSDISLLNYFKTHTNTILYFLTITLLTSLLIPITGNIIPLTYVSHLKPTKALQNE